MCHTCSLFYSTNCCFLIFLLFVRFFFFKQKTAYEMRISDWADVCSSDLTAAGLLVAPPRSTDAPTGVHLSPATRMPHSSTGMPLGKIGRASCRERVCQYV